MKPHWIERVLGQDYVLGTRWLGGIVYSKRIHKYITHFRDGARDIAEYAREEDAKDAIEAYWTVERLVKLRMLG